MKLSLSTAFLVVTFQHLAVMTGAFGVESSSSSRRDVLASSAAAAACVAFGWPGTARAALTACPPKSNNCIRTAWTAPDGTQNVAQSVQTILDSYPQEGQNKVDLGGWSVVENNLVSTGKARVEFKSGLGNFAKFLNGNKPFVDDLEIAIDGNTVELRSASRVGDSDFGVNQKRLQFLAAKAQAMGFNTPEPRY